MPKPAADFDAISAILIVVGPLVGAAIGFLYGRMFEAQAQDDKIDDCEALGHPHGAREENP